MEETKKPKPKKGNPSWPSGKPKPLSAIDGKARKAAGLQPGGALSWPGWTLKEAKRQGQQEMFPGHQSEDPDLALARQAKRKRRFGVWG
jgi:hypothetical protein